MARPLGLAGALISLVTLLAYAFDFEPMYRPITDGPATHPLTAVMLGMIGIGLVFYQRNAKNHITLISMTIAMCIGGVRLFEIYSGYQLLDQFSPFHPQLETAAMSGHPIKMGWNTASAGILASIAMMLIIRKRFTSGQVVSVIAILFPFIGLTGFAYGIQKFYGQMSMTTVLIATPVVAGVMLQSAHRGLLRHILNPWIGGRLARLQLALGATIPAMLGYFVVKAATGHPLDTFGIYVVLISTFISGLVTYSAVIHERYDRLRRIAERKLEQDALEDALTKLPNRRLLFAHGEQLLSRCSRNSETMTVLMLDIDYFKSVNDTFGHKMGDQVLKKLAELIPALLRQQDLMARYGGEEFAILLPGTPAEGGKLIAEKIIAAVVQSTFPHHKQITVSIGCAEYSKPQTFSELLSAADKQLYLAKQNGRNQVMVENQVRLDSVT